MTSHPGTRALAAALATATGLLALATSIAPSAASAAEGVAAPTAPTRAAAGLQPRTAATKTPHAKLVAGQSREYVQVKFAEGSRVRLRGGRLVSLGGRDLSALRGVVDKKAGSVSRLFSADEQELDDTSARVTRQSSRQQADLNLYFRLRLKPGVDAATAVDALNALDVVETAYPEPLPVSQPVSPSYTAYQGYHSPASASGIDANYAWTVSGGTGANVRVHDIEYSWNGAHEDLSKLTSSYFPNGTFRDPYNDDNHGTAVIGEIAGDSNTYGVTGLVPAATIQVTNANNTERGYDLANSIYTATRNLRAGDVMLLEQQIGGPHGCDTNQVGCVAVEWVPAFYDAIVNATSQGIVVIEPAGNGYQNLDAVEYGTVFPQGRADSGAILVGAGGAPGCRGARTRLDFSDYGRRVDLQGWGECVVTTGYGDLLNTAHNSAYTRQFGGTSSASPIVASAAAALSSVAKARGILLSPRDIRARLKATGTPQTAGLAGNIGPLPNLRAAIAGLSATTDTTAPIESTPTQYVPYGGSIATTVPVTFRWGATDASGVNAYAVVLQTNGGSFVRQTLPTATTTAMTWALTPGNTYRLGVAAHDTAGNWSGYVYGSTFGVGLWQENSAYATFSAGWSPVAWTAASGGALKVTGTRGAAASFTFTGRNVSWIGSKAANRGQAYIYLDGVYKGVVDAYSATTIARSVLASYVWPTTGTHTLRVVAVGTAGRPTIDVDAFARLS